MTQYNTIDKIEVTEVNNETGVRRNPSIFSRLPGVSSDNNVYKQAELQRFVHNFNRYNEDHPNAATHLEVQVFASDAVVNDEEPIPETIEKTLEVRDNRYGEFRSHAAITQELKNTMHFTDGWKKLSDDKKEALEMIQHKVGRILNGDPEYHDSWHDIVGYAKLVADKIQSDKKVNKN